MQTGRWDTGKKLCCKASEDLGQQQVEHKSRMCPGSEEGQQYPGMHQTALLLSS